MSVFHSGAFRFAHCFRFLIAMLGVALLSACVSTPDVVAPVREAAEGVDWLAGTHEVDEYSVHEVQSEWWHTFDDPVLERILESAKEHSFDLRKSQSQLREAHAMARQVGSALWPTVSATGSYTWTEQSVNSPSGPSSLIQAGFIDRDLEFWGADVGAQWDVDLFGANRFASRSAFAQTQASRAALQAVGLATLGQVTLTYIQYNGINQRLVILKNNVAAQARAFEILQKRLAIGLENRLNVDRAAGQLAANRAGIPTLEARRQTAVYQLALLTGLEVVTLQKLLDDAKPMSTDELVPSVGIKAELLIRRPDVRVAEYQLYSAGAEVGRARADLLPRLVIAATSGFSSGSTSTLFDSASRALALAPTINVPVFNRGRLKAAKEAAMARYDYALAHYQQTVARAFTDVETRLINLTAARDSAALITEAAENNRAAVERAQKLYDRGLLSYLELLDAQRQQLSADDAAARASAGRDAALVQLYLSLGGGWQLSPSGIASSP